MEIEKTFRVDYSGKNPWDQYYDNRVSFDSEEEADAFIQKLMEDENWIDNLNECDSICTRFINHIRRMEIDENINIESLSVLEQLSGYGGANLDGFRFEITLAIPNTGYCGV